MPDFYRLLEKKEPIFVTNHSGGKIILELKREGHKSKPFTAMVPPIKDYPILLSKLVPYAILEYDHSTVYDWIQKRLLRLHDPKKVRSMYAADPELQDAVEEMVAEANKKRKFKTADIGLVTADGARNRAEGFTGKRNTTELGEVATEIGANAPMEVSREGNAVTLRLAAEQQKINPKVAQLMATLNQDGSRQGDVLIKLKTMDKELLTADALGFVIDNSGKHPNINKWARGARAGLISGSGDADDDDVDYDDDSDDSTTMRSKKKKKR